MAIIIPSKRIYEIDNPKVLENALKSIDIRQKSVKSVVGTEKSQKLTDELQYKSTEITETYDKTFFTENPAPITNKLSGIWVFNNSLNLPSAEIIINILFKCDNVLYNQIGLSEWGMYYGNSAGTQNAYGLTWTDEKYRTIEFVGTQSATVAFFDWLPQNAVWQIMLLSGIQIDSIGYTASATLPRKQDGYYITDIAPTLELDYDVEISKTQATSVWGDTPKMEFYEGKEYSARQTSARNFNYDSETTKYGNNSNIKLDSAVTILPDKVKIEFTTSINKDIIQTDIDDITAELINSFYAYKIQNTPLTTDEEYALIIRFVGEMTVWLAQDDAQDKKRGNFGRPCEGQKIGFKVKSARLVYNETVRTLETTESDLALVSETAQGEATYSIGANQFIRAENEYDGAQGATSILYGKTLADYQKGVETANLRCSINEYFDENDNIVISTQTANKMIFDLYDEVVPMLLNWWGEDAPISYNKQGLAKTFKVVGIGNIGDGAVWQRLTLREFGAIAIKVKLPKPMLTLNGRTLEIFDKSKEAEQFAIYVDGTLAATISANSLDIDTLNLNGGTHRIYAIAKATKYKDSDKSRAVSFTKRYTNVRIVENESGGLTYIIESNDYHAYNGEYKIGGVL